MEMLLFNACCLVAQACTMSNKAVVLYCNVPAGLIMHPLCSFLR
jgi:hypothetical protein